MHSKFNFREQPTHKTNKESRSFKDDATEWIPTGPLTCWSGARWWKYSGTRTKSPATPISRRSSTNSPLLPLRPPALPLISASLPSLLATTHFLHSQEPRSSTPPLCLNPFSPKCPIDQAARRRPMRCPPYHSHLRLRDESLRPTFSSQLNQSLLATWVEIGCDSATH